MNRDTRRPCASIILSAGACTDGMAETVESILCQSCPDLELIVADDGSSEAVQELRAAFPDPRIVYLRVPGPCGAARAWNAGIGMARGELVGFARSGDIWDERKLEELAGAFSRLDPACGVVYSDRWEITPAGNRAYWHMPDMDGPGILDRYGTGFLAESLGTGPILVRRPFLERAGPFDEELRGFAETDMIIRLQRLCLFHHLPQPLYSRRIQQADSGNPFGQSIARLLLLQKYPEALASPVFLAHQAELIRRSLRTVPGTSSDPPGQSPQETGTAQYRRPVPYS